MRRGIGVIAFVVALLSASSAFAASPALHQTLVAGDGNFGDNFAGAVAVDGDTAVVGDQYSNGGAGAVYEYQRTGDSWDLVAKLTASNGMPNDNLGHSVAIDGDVIAAGAPAANVAGTPSEGLVYTFSRTGPVVRTETARLYALGAGSVNAAEVGFSVAIDGDEIVTGAVGIASGRGAVYRFPSTGNSAVLNELPGTLHATDGAAGDNLGWSVAIDGDEIVAGAESADVAANTFQGAAYTFSRTGDTAETAKLTASDGADDDRFGGSVAIDGDTIVVGSSGSSVGSSSHQGAAYTFTRAGASRTQTSKLIESDGGPNDALGSGVAIAGDTIVVGAPADDLGTNTDQGSVYTFPRAGTGTRSEVAKLTAPDGASGDAFGSAVAMAGTTLLAGAPNDDIGSNNEQGSATVFYDPAPTPEPTPTPTPTPTPDTTPPTLNLSAPTSEGIHKTIKVTATCDEACSISLTGSVKPKHDDRSQLAPTEAQLAAGVATKIKIKLGKLKHALKDAGKGKAKLSAIATDAAANASAASTAKIKLD